MTNSGDPKDPKYLKEMQKVNDDYEKQKKLCEKRHKSQFCSTPIKSTPAAIIQMGMCLTEKGKISKCEKKAEELKKFSEVQIKSRYNIPPYNIDLSKSGKGDSSSKSSVTSESSETKSSTSMLLSFLLEMDIMQIVIVTFII